MTAEEYRKDAPTWADDAMRFVRRVCDSKAECEDAVQDALLRLWERRNDVESGKGRSYLMGSAYHNIVNRLRRTMVERRYEAETMEGQMAMPNERFDLRDAIGKALSTLPEVQRAIVQLRDVEGYSYKEIASILALSESQVEVYLFRARVKMRKQLIQMGYDNNR